MNTKIKILNAVAPLYTRRRLLLSMFKDLLSGRGAHRLNQQNCANWRKYGHTEFMCNVCAKHGVAFYDFPDVQVRKLHRVGLLRETLACRNCGASLRTRTLAFGLLKIVNEKLGAAVQSIDELAVQGLQGLRVLDTDAFSPISHRLAKVKGYARSSFLPEYRFGTEVAPGYFNINLEEISFEKDAFDIVLSSDVMEHVRFCEKAHAEIYRILGGDGAYIFNVPNDMNMQENWILVDPKDDKVLVDPPHYHGDPLSGGILSYRVFGQELLIDLKKIGFTTEFFLVQEPSRMIVDGDLFVARKKVFK